ncbi:putative lysine methyltransferase, S-adenosyl-L-methionine-dependent methyltransferase [Dioscorea sansibarensis]
MAAESDEEDQENAPHLLPLLQDQVQDHSPSEHQQEHYLNSISATLSIRQLRSQGLSFQLWPAAYTLVSLLDSKPQALFPLNPNLRILELGSGTGLLGLAAAAILRAHVTLTDLPHVLPNLRFNADSNADTITSRGGSVQIRQLQWGNRVDADALGGAEAFDAVLASDVVYYEHLLDPLLETLRVFVNAEKVFVMGHLRRWKKRDAVFFRKARKVFDVLPVHADAPLPGSRVGVVVYRFKAKKKNPTTSCGTTSSEISKLG